MSYHCRSRVRAESNPKVCNLKDKEEVSQHRAVIDMWTAAFGRPAVGRKMRCYGLSQALGNKCSDRGIRSSNDSNVMLALSWACVRPTPNNCANSHNQAETETSYERLLLGQPPYRRGLRGSTSGYAPILEEHQKFPTESCQSIARRADAITSEKVNASTSASRCPAGKSGDLRPPISSTRIGLAMYFSSSCR